MARKSLIINILLLGLFSIALAKDVKPLLAISS